MTVWICRLSGLLSSRCFSWQMSIDFSYVDKRIMASKLTLFPSSPSLSRMRKTPLWWKPSSTPSMMTTSQAYSTSWAHCPTMTLTNPTRSATALPGVVGGGGGWSPWLYTSKFMVKKIPSASPSPPCCYKLRTVEKSLLRREWIELEMRSNAPGDFLHAKPFPTTLWMCSSWKWNCHLWVWIQQRKAGCSPGCPHSCYTAVVVRLLRPKKLCGVGQWW